jgi:hypothetical protein
MGNDPNVSGIFVRPQAQLDFEVDVPGRGFGPFA